MTQDAKLIKKDRMRYTKNTFSANLVLAAILFDVFYFVSIYQSDVGSYYYNMLVGASIIYNLVFLLASFLASEGVKSRGKGYPQLLVVLGLLQIGRIFIIPMQAHAAMIKDVQVMGNGQFIWCIVCLLASAACCIGGGITSYLNNKTLNDYLKTIEQPKVQGR